MFTVDLLLVTDFIALTSCWLWVILISCNTTIFIGFRTCWKALLRLRDSTESAQMWRKKRRRIRSRATPPQTAQLSRLKLINCLRLGTRRRIKSLRWVILIVTHLFTTLLPFFSAHACAFSQVIKSEFYLLRWIYKITSYTCVCLFQQSCIYLVLIVVFSKTKRLKGVPPLIGINTRVCWNVLTDELLNSFMSFWLYDCCQQNLQ